MNNQLNEFQQTGFTRLPLFFSNEEVQELLDLIEAFITKAGPQLSEQDGLFRDSSGEVIQIFGLHALSLNFKKLLNDPRLLQLASEYLDSEAHPYTLQYRRTPSGSEHQTPVHQDCYGPFYYPSELVTFWLSLGDYDEHSGCLRYFKGSHHKGYQPHLFGTLDERHQELMSSEICMPTQCGDLLIHDGFTLHRSDLNQGKIDRPALMFSYVSKHSKKLEKQEWLDIYQ